MKEFTFFRTLTGSTVVLVVNITDFNMFMLHCAGVRQLERLGFEQTACRLLPGEVEL